LLAQQNSEAWFSKFKSFVGLDLQTDDWLAWRRGDLGILIALAQVARRTGRPDWQRAAHSLLEHCLAWPTDKPPIGGTCLADGAAGVAHVFNRLYQADGDPRCLDAARAWFKWTISIAHRTTESETAATVSPREFRRSSLYDGAIGVALALLAALSAIEPAWDRLLFLPGTVPAWDREDR
jgi:lantibiotic modifying enzyme